MIVKRDGPVIDRIKKISRSSMSFYKVGLFVVEFVRIEEISELGCNNGF